MEKGPARKIKIWDTTLRDGEQSPGCSMGIREKLSIARRLELLRVDCIEAGFPAASEEDFEAVKAIAAEVKGAAVFAFARAKASDVELAAKALSAAEAGGIQLCIATSALHMEKKLKLEPGEVLSRIDQMVRLAKQNCALVQFAAEDAVRSDRGFLLEALRTAVAAGADSLCIPDTVGYSTPSGMAELIAFLAADSGLEGAYLSVHCHNDLGMATANTLAALEAGAAQAECTINGIGERAGMAALEEVVMAILTRRDYYNMELAVDPSKIYHTSRLLSSILGRRVPQNKPIVGASVFMHEAGIHQHGVTADRNTYEIFTPQTIGMTQNQLVLGKHSGRHGFEERLAQLGLHLEKSEVELAFAQVKALSAKKKEITDKDLETIIGAQLFRVEQIVSLERFIVNSGNTIPGVATVKLTVDGVQSEKTAMGDGPIDAAFKAISRIVGRDFELSDYNVSSVGEGEDAQGEVTVRVQSEGEIFVGRGLSTDIIEASLLAFINAINKSLAAQKQAER